MFLVVFDHSFFSGTLHAQRFDIFSKVRIASKGQVIVQNFLPRFDGSNGHRRRLHLGMISIGMRCIHRINPRHERIGHSHFQIDVCFRDIVLCHIGSAVATVIDKGENIRLDGLLWHSPRFLRISVRFGKDKDDPSLGFGMNGNVFDHVVVQLGGPPFHHDALYGIFQGNVTSRQWDIDFGKDSPSGMIAHLTLGDLKVVLHGIVWKLGIVSVLSAVFVAHVGGIFVDLDRPGAAELHGAVFGRIPDRSHDGAVKPNKTVDVSFQAFVLQKIVLRFVHAPQGGSGLGFKGHSHGVCKPGVVWQSQVVFDNLGKVGCLQGIHFIVLVVPVHVVFVLE
mmetsp:Transcript_28187/g.46716  ORF Transcript_28187/g.46716 Transcript_28187/m.46716 type:complete len:336 (+) Transcript_28187:308-1315(+)